MLNDQDKIELDKFPTLSECTEAILNMKNIRLRDLMDYRQNFPNISGKLKRILLLYYSRNL